ncbi:slipin family protein [Catellatospora sichuanensis]|uniref:slipin family protein n=1 Tax=Catellatospora sichuanensis TaxID=1969805 RepID=UPI0011834836|nr:slipin family protein [Catellatospora sichuanensis]
MSSTVIALIIALAVVLLLFFASVRVFPEYERGVIFRLGRVIGAKGPGLFFIIPVVDRVVRVSLRTVTMEIPPQDVITRDNVTVRVNAVTYFNVIDPIRSVVAIENYTNGTFQIAQTTLRSILGQVDLDELLTKRDEINQRLQRIVDDVTSPWGVKVTLVEIKDVELPESMRRAMAAQAEAERERRAKVIHAKGEYQAATDLARAAQLLEEHPAALQLRVLGTMVEVSAERNSTLIFPVPVELLRMVDVVRRNAEGASTSPDQIPP